MLLSFLGWIAISSIAAVLINRTQSDKLLTPAMIWLLFLSTFAVFAELPIDTPVNALPQSWVTDDVQQLKQGLQVLVSKAEKGSDINLGLLAILLMLAVSIKRLSKLFLHYVKLRRLVFAGVPYRHPLLNAKGFIFGGSHSAFVIGFFKPVIALPAFFVDLNDKQQEIILRHELFHIAKGDHRGAFIWRLLSELCWFNPAIRVFEKQYLVAIEARCDQGVIQQGIGSREYAETLLLSIKNSFNTAQQGSYASFNSPAFSLQEYKHRLSRVLSESNRNWSAMFILPLLLMSVLTLTTAKAALSTDRPIEWQSPVEDFRITSGFGEIAKFRNMQTHKGLDLKGPVGTPVYATSDGMVVVADQTTLKKNYGKAIVLQHGSEWQSLYAHLSEIKVAPEQQVKAGELIGLIGTTGKVTGPHLHFEMTFKGNKVNPMKYLKASQ